MLLTLLVRLYYSKKTISLREYAVGHKQFTTPTLVATMLATEYGGGALIRNIQEVYNLGLYWAITKILTSVLIWMISPIMLRMAPFMQHISMAETIGHVYGIYPRIIAALSGILRSIAELAIQIQATSLAIKICIHATDIDQMPNITTIITMIATFILVFYSAFGGIRTVTFTDMLQFVAFAIVIPLLAYFMFQSIHKPLRSMIPLLQSHEKFNSVFRQDVSVVAMITMILSGMVAFIHPANVQRMYMASDSIQAKRVFGYTGFFALLIKIIIVLVGVFVFLGNPNLPKTDVWEHVTNNVPSYFQGFIAISLLAMAMSTADSNLNSCAVMVSHDIAESIRQVYLPNLSFLRRLVMTVSSITPIKLARYTSVVVGLAAMMVAFRCEDLLKLLQLTYALSLPIITAPFFLAIFGFRGSTRTALIGMVTGALSMLAWRHWVHHTIDGGFPCMLANGLAMLAAHYLLPRETGTGWVGPDKIYKQKQQERERIARRRRKAIKAIFTHKKDSLAILQPTSSKLLWISSYMLITSLIALYYTSNTQGAHTIPYAIVALVVSTLFTVYAIFIDIQHYPPWIVGGGWFIGLICCLPLHSVYSLWHTHNVLMLLVFSLTHFGIVLWAFPFYIGLIIAVPFPILYAIGAFKITSIWPLDMVLGPLLVLGITLFTLMVYGKHLLTKHETSYLYFRTQQKLKESYKLKSLAYALELPTATPDSQLATEGTILEQAIQNVTQSISFPDEYTTFYKEDFQTIIHKFSEWAIYLKQRAKSQSHALLQPSVISLEDFIDEIEVSYEKEQGVLPSLWAEKIELAGNIPATIIGDRTQLVQLLIMALTYLSKKSSLSRTLITLQLHTTHLQYKKSEPIDSAYPSLMVFPAVALLLIHSQEESNNTIPEVESVYGDDTEDSTKPHNDPILQEKSNLKKQKMERIVRAHYGHMALTSPNAILLVIPRDVTQIKEEMLAVSLPREAGTSEESTLTPQEQAESLTKLIDFHDWVCSTTTVEPTVISEILLLLRRCYGFKRHPSGQLFYLRTVGIATWVARWVGYYPKLIYAALLYDLVRYTRLPLSYIKANYNLGVLCFVENILSIDSCSEWETSLLAVSNRFKGALEKEQLSVLYIKLAERLYDLEHAAGYTQPESIKNMAKESLTIDVKLAQRYVEPEIAATLAQTASKVLNSCVVQN